MRALVLLRLSVVVPALLTVQCGGSHAGARGSDAAPGRSSSAEDAPGGAGAGRTETVDPCRDGHCFSCGEGVCPQGFYCDESAEPACGWLPACATAPDCTCLERELGDACRCEARDGRPFVTCD